MHATSLARFRVVRLAVAAVLVGAICGNAQAWQYTGCVSGGLGEKAAKGRSPIDSAGNVLVACGLSDIAIGVAKLDAHTGSEVWRRSITSLTSAISLSQALVTVGPGDTVIGVGWGQRWSDGQSVFAVSKWDAGGALLWSYEDSTFALPAIAYDLVGIVADAAGDVFVAANVSPVQFVAKFSGGDGTRLWLKTSGSIAASGGVLTDIALDPSGNPIAVGSRYAFGGVGGFFAFKLAGGSSNGDLLWEYNPDDSTSQFSSATYSNVAIDDDGDAIAVGTHGSYDGDSFVHYSMSAVKLHGTDGLPVWGPVDIDGNAIYKLTDGVGILEAGLTLALDADGNPVIGGSLAYGVSGSLSTEFFVAKLSAATGSEVWRKSPQTSGVAHAVAVDAAGDVLASGDGDVESPVSSRDVRVYKLAGATGVEQWHHDFPSADAARFISVDGQRNVLVATQAAGSPIVKLNASGGEDCYCGCPDGAMCAACGEQCDDGNAVDGDGCSATCQDQAASDSVTDTVPAGGGTVTTDTGTGATPLHPVRTSVTSPNEGTTITITEGSVTTPNGGYQFLGQEVAITALPATPENPLVFVFKLDASRVPAGIVPTGVDVLRNGVPLVPCTGAPGVADPDPCIVSRILLGGAEAGDLQITVSTSHASAWNLGLPATPTPTATVTPTPTPTLTPFAVSGKQLQIKDNADPTKRKLQFASKDARISTVGVDPVADGALLQLHSANGETLCLALPSVGGTWQSKGTPPNVSYQYKDKLGIHGPCQQAALKNKQLKVSCSGKIVPIAFTLDEPSQQNVGAWFTSGSRTFCASFGGTIKKDSGTDPPNAGGKGTFLAVNAPALENCAAPVPCP